MSRRLQLGQYMTPMWIAAQMCEQIRKPVSEWVVLDPACGDGNLLIAAVNMMKKAGISNPQERVMGMDVDMKMVEKARQRLAQTIGCNPQEINVLCGDFFKLATGSLFSRSPLIQFSFNVILSNPPYGQSREYKFFEESNRISQDGTELVFLVPLAFLDRIIGVDFTPLNGKPMGVTTGHAIVHHMSGNPFKIRPVKGAKTNNRGFSVLTGVKLYEVGAGEPAQTREVVTKKPYSSSDFREGWVPCLRTGDIQPFSATIGRLWVNYGPHLAHPKEKARFQGPRLFIRRMPLWTNRQLGAAYIEDFALCAGDVLVVRHETNDQELLKGLAVFLNSADAADAILEQRPSVRYRVSYPKISAKDLNLLLDTRVPSDDVLRTLANRDVEHIVESYHGKRKQN